MTREEARKAAEVMLAYADGKDIEYLDIVERWVTTTNPIFNLELINIASRKNPPIAHSRIKRNVGMKCLSIGLLGGFKKKIVRNMCLLIK